MPERRMAPDGPSPEDHREGCGCWRRGRQHPASISPRRPGEWLFFKMVAIQFEYSEIYYHMLFN